MDADMRNIQNDFFNAARKEKTPVTVFLTSGKKLVGRIKSFDKFTILLDSHYGEQIIRMRPGDSIYYDSNEPHSFVAVSQQRPKGIAVIYADTH